MDYSELDLFQDISMEIKKEIFEKYPDHYLFIMTLFRANKRGAFKVENGKVIKIDPPPPPLPTDDKRTLNFRERRKQYERFLEKASICRCPKGTHEEKKVADKTTAGEPG